MEQEFEVVIGLEVHAELATASKIFCNCATSFGAQPNSQVCPVCLGLPGTLPVLNYQVLRLAMRAALALNCSLAPRNGRTKFDRKNYFYPDLPKAYQISQYDLPLAEHGSLVIDVAEGQKTVGITRVHMEEDAGKLVHQGGRGQIGSATGSLVDYNRAGVPLIEIVSEPDLRSPDEAYAYLTSLKEILRYSEVSDCNMEEGSLRCDANISIRPKGETKLGTKVEVKNMNSFKNVRQALEYEARRQARVVKEGGRLVQETRLWDAEREVTLPMRGKEEAHDYRYFPEPDLPEMMITPEMTAEIKQELPELPRARRARFVQAYGLGDYDAQVLTSSRELADYFEQGAARTPAPKTLSNWLTVELLGKLNAEGKSIAQSPVSAEHLAALVNQIEGGKISGKMGKQVFAEMSAGGGDPESIIRKLGLSQISDPVAIGQLVDSAIAANPGPVSEYRAGKSQTFGFLVGQVLKASKGQADPKMVNQILKEKLMG